jgi:hypothetical protein
MCTRYIFSFLAVVFIYFLTALWVFKIIKLTLFVLLELSNFDSVLAGFLLFVVFNYFIFFISCFFIKFILHNSNIAPNFGFHLNRDITKYSSLLVLLDRIVGIVILPIKCIQYFFSFFKSSAFVLIKLFAAPQSLEYGLGLFCVDLLAVFCNVIFMPWLVGFCQCLSHFVFSSAYCAEAAVNIIAELPNDFDRNCAVTNRREQLARVKSLRLDLLDPAKTTLVLDNAQLKNCDTVGGSGKLDEPLYIMVKAVSGPLANSEEVVTDRLRYHRANMLMLNTFVERASYARYISNVVTPFQADEARVV